MNIKHPEISGNRAHLFIAHDMRTDPPGRRHRRRRRGRRMHKLEATVIIIIGRDLYTYCINKNTYFPSVRLEQRPSNHGCHSSSTYSRWETYISCTKPSQQAQRPSSAPPFFISNKEGSSSNQNLKYDSINRRQTLYTIHTQLCKRIHHRSHPINGRRKDPSDQRNHTCPT